MEKAEEEAQPLRRSSRTASIDAANNPPAPVLRRSARTASIDASNTIAEQVTPRKAKQQAKEEAASAHKLKLLEAIPEEQEEAVAKPATRRSTRGQKPAAAAEEEEEKPPVAIRKSTRGKKAVEEESPVVEEQQPAAVAPKSTTGRRTRSTSIAETLEELPIAPVRSTRKTRSNSIAGEELEEFPIAPAKSSRKAKTPAPPTVQEATIDNDDDGDAKVSTLDLSRKSVGEANNSDNNKPSVGEKKEDTQVVAPKSTDKTPKSAKKATTANLGEESSSGHQEPVVEATEVKETPAKEQEDAPLKSAKKDKTPQKEQQPKSAVKQTPKIAKKAEAAETATKANKEEASKSVEKADGDDKEAPNTAVKQTPKNAKRAEQQEAPKSAKTANKVVEAKTPKTAVMEEVIVPVEPVPSRTPKSNKKAKQAPVSAVVVAVKEENPVAIEEPVAAAAPPKSNKKAHKSTVDPVANGGQVEEKQDELPLAKKPKQESEPITPAPLSKSAKKAAAAAAPKATTPVELPKSNKKTKLAVEEQEPVTPAPVSHKKKKDDVASSTKKPFVVGSARASDAANQILGDLSKRSTALHRGQFVEFKPEGVEALSGNGKFLAVGRASGEVEVWEKRNNNQALHQRQIIPGTRSQSLRCLVWFGDRLFGGNLNGTLFEVDFNTLTQIPCEVGGGGGVWSMDASSVYVLTACEDGRVRLYQPSAIGFGLDYVKSLSGGGSGRLLCIKVHGSNGNYCYTSGMDGAIRKWDLAQKRVIDQIIVPVSYARQVTVWSLDTCGEALACGDSLGRVHIWKDDASTPQSFSEHRGDVLAVKFASQGSALFASGVDSRLALFRFLAEAKDWVYVYSHRAHTHDVRALGLFAEDGEVIVSAGVDTQLCWYPTSTFEQVRPKKESLYRQAMPNVVASEALDLLLVQHTCHLDLWRVDAEEKSHVHLAALQFNGDSAVRQCALSRTGRFIACILLNDLHVFEFIQSSETDVAIQRRRIAKIRDAVALTFTSDQFLLVSTAQGLVSLDVEIGEIVNETSTGRVLMNLCTSSDGQWIAATVSSAKLGEPEAVEIFNLDVMRTHEVLPSSLFGAAGHAALAFSPCSKRLIVARLDGSIHAVEIDLRQLTAGFALNCSFQDRILGITFNQAEPGAVIAWSWAQLSIMNQVGKPRILKKCKPLVFVHFFQPDKVFVLEAPFVNAFKFLPDVAERERYGA